MRRLHAGTWTCAAILVFLTPTLPDDARPPKLYKDGRQMLAIFRAQGRQEATLLIAAKEGKTLAIARAAGKIGGNVRYRDDEIGYLRVRLPIDRAVEFSEIDEIEAVTVDIVTSDPYRMGLGGGPLGRRDPSAGEPRLTPIPRRPPAPADTEPWPPIAGDFPLRNPYSPLADIDAAQFRAKHPTFDGRGVTIVLLDGNFDLLLPEFQTAYTVEGKKVPKVADFLNVTDPRDDSAYTPQWVDMKNLVTSTGKRVTFQGRTFATARDGRYRIGFFNERRFNDPSNGAYLDQDVDRDGNPRGDDGLFGVLWDERTNDVWVDTDRDTSFADEKAMTDYLVRNDRGVFGKDDPATPMREEIGFAVQTDAKNKFISINVGIYQHATEIMGSVVGNREPAGRLEGIAPGARLISAFYGVSIGHSLIEGLIAAFKHPLSDIVVLEQSSVIASDPYHLADGHHPISVIAQRLIDRYRKLLFVPGSNDPGFGLVAEDGLAPGAVSVGGYQNRESYRLNNGLIPESADNMHWGGLSHGPGGGGALKPDLLAPSGQMSTDLGYLYRKSMQEFPGLYQLPSGYAVDGGTSTATPMAAGAAALVVSAAKQTKVPYDATRLKAALTGSARFIPNLGAHEQGNGLVQVEAAYQLLKTIRALPIRITAEAPVDTRLGGLAATPNVGVGLYQREGWKVGDSATRTVRLTRSTGPDEPLIFRVTWQGDDRTFASDSSVTLPLGLTVELPIGITVKTAGAHTAIMTLDHPAVVGHAHRMLMTVVAPLELTSDSGFVTTSISLPRPGDRPVFVRVPAGARALIISAESPDGPVDLGAVSPSRDLISPCPDGSSVGCVIPIPEPGVWEINVSATLGVARKFDPARPRPLKPAAVTVSAKLAGVEVLAQSPSEPSTGAINIPVSLKNGFGPIAANLETTPLASVFRSRQTISEREQHLSEVMVPKGATSIRAKIWNVTPGADLDLYLLDCGQEPASEDPPIPVRDRGNKAPPVPRANCRTRAVAASIESGGEVTFQNPSPGRWVVVVDGYRLPNGSASYQYLDGYTSPTLGSVVVAELEAPRGLRATWSGIVHVWPLGKVASGRGLEAWITVTTSDGKLADGSRAPIGSVEIPVGFR